MFTWYDIVYAKSLGSWIFYIEWLIKLNSCLVGFWFGWLCDLIKMKWYVIEFFLCYKGCMNHLDGIVNCWTGTKWYCFQKQRPCHDHQLLTSQRDVDSKWCHDVDTHEFVMWLTELATLRCGDCEFAKSVLNF